MTKVLIEFLLALSIFCYIMAEITGGAKPTPEIEVPVPTVAEIMEDAARDHGVSISETDTTEESGTSNTPAHRRDSRLWRPWF
jgi:hypothetical protein